MLLRDKIRAARAVFAVRFLGRRIPLFLSWPVTNRCNYRCSYCDRPNQVDTELTTEQALSVIDEFAGLGTQFIFLSGGEPLVRKDLPAIIDRCRARRMFTCLTTNGALYLQRKQDIGRVDMLKISLDGPASVHDGYRAAGSYDEVIAVLEDARRDRIPVMLNPVVSKASIGAVDEIIQTATRYGAGIKFQPINHGPAGTKDIGRILLDHDELMSLSSGLLEKRRRSPAVMNSAAGLRYMATLPEGSAIPCYAGRLFAYLMPNGLLFPCNKREEIAEGRSCLGSGGVRGAVEGIERVGCRTCWCTSDAELNLMMRMDAGSIWAAARRALGRWLA